MRRIALSLLVLSLPSSVFIGRAISKLPTEVIPAVLISSEVPCQEDEPCWDCNTMGNLVCGTQSGNTLQADADAAWEGLSSEEQNYLNSIGASDQEVIDFRFSDRIIPQIAQPEVLTELPRTL